MSELYEFLKSLKNICDSTAKRQIAPPQKGKSLI
jgi:hypothetical protein